MKLQREKKKEINELSNASKELLLWVELNFETPFIEISKQTYLQEVKVSLNTFKKGLKGLLEKEILTYTGKRNYYKLNDDYFDLTSYINQNNLNYLKDIIEQSTQNKIQISKIKHNL